jgi:Anti-sigma factor NepR
MPDRKQKAGKTQKLKTDKAMISPNPSLGIMPMRDVIGEKLRAYYENVASEPVPDRFADLLKQLEAATGPKKVSE